MENEITKETAKFVIDNGKMQLKAEVTINYAVRNFDIVIKYGFPNFDIIDISKEIRMAENPEWTASIGNLLIQCSDIAQKELSIIN